MQKKKSAFFHKHLSWKGKFNMVIGDARYTIPSSFLPRPGLPVRPMWTLPFSPVSQEKNPLKHWSGTVGILQNYFRGGGGWLGTPKIKVLSILSCVYIVLTYFVWTNSVKIQCFWIAYWSNSLSSCLPLRFQEFWDHFLKFRIFE